MDRYNYFAPPRNSPRAKAFRAAHGGAPLGQDFMFENQPYARPGPAGLLEEEGPGTATGYVEIQQYPGLNAEEGPGTMTGYRPIERMNPNDRAYMSPEMVAEIAAKEANRKRLGARIGGRTKVLRDRPVWDHFEKRWVEPEGSFAQSPHALDSLENQGIRDRWASDPYNAPRFASTNQRGVAEGFTHGMSGPGSDVTGMYARSGGEGLLSDQSSPIVDRDWIDNPTPTQQPLLASSSGVDKSGTTDRSGWEKNKVMWDLIRMGLGGDDSWTPGVEY